MSRHARLGLATITLALVACTAAPGASPSPSPPTSPTQTGPAGLDGRQFLSTDVIQNGEPIALVNGTQIRISFSDGQLTAQAGCNTMGGSYRLDGGQLVVDSLGMTEMGCNPPLHEQDQWLAAFLTSRPTVALDGPNLTLAAEGTTITLLDREVAEPDQQLAGPTWVLDSIISGDAVASVPQGVMATIRFLSDGTFELQPGCNSGSGRYAVDGDQITFHDIVMTEMACGGPAGQVEGDVLAVLGAGPVDFGIEADTLTLMAGNVGLQLTALGTGN